MFGISPQGEVLFFVRGSGLQRPDRPGREKGSYMIDICIIGGGAAGMAAALCAKEADPSLDVVLLEKKNQLGKKILATGNGKCNLSNKACPGAGRTQEFFRRLGLLTRTDSAGRMYPYTEEARAVQNALAGGLARSGVQVETSAEVIAVSREGAHFRISLAKGDFAAKKVLIASGGKAGPVYGSTGDGFRFARRLGHTVTKLIPVLTAIEVKEDVQRLSGIRAKAAVSLEYGGEPLLKEIGEIQFTGTGVSGICVFNLSRYLLVPEGKSLADGFDDYRILIDFFPQWDDMEGLLQERQAMGFSGGQALQFLVRGPIAAWIEASSKGDLRQMAQLLKAFPLSPKGVRGWDFAQVTKGGVCLDEVDPKTCQSRLVDGLYFAGEVLDFDGPCGGYNLQHAWETGMLAGREMAK